MVQRCPAQNNIFAPKFAFAVWILITGVICFCGRLEAASPKIKATNVRVFAHAKIQKGIAVRSENRGKLPKSNNFPAANISIRECDIEAAKLSKNCVFIIYEMQ